MLSSSAEGPPGQWSRPGWWKMPTPTSCCWKRAMTIPTSPTSPTTSSTVTPGPLKSPTPSITGHCGAPSRKSRARFTWPRARSSAAAAPSTDRSIYAASPRTSTTGHPGATTSGRTPRCCPISGSKRPTWISRTISMARTARFPSAGRPARPGL